MSADFEKQIFNKAEQVAREEKERAESTVREAKIPLNYQFSDTGVLSTLKHTLDIDEIGIGWADKITCKDGCLPPPETPKDLVIMLEDLRKEEDSIKL